MFARKVAGDYLYHVGLDLTSDQVKELRQLALSRDQSVKDLVKDLVVDALQKGGATETKSKAAR